MQDAPGHIPCDVADEGELIAVLDDIEKQIGPIDIYVSNAGVLSEQKAGVGSASNADWVQCWNVNLMAHVYAARHLVPKMTAGGGGHFVIVASAAGLLNQIGDAAYSATKHAAVSFAESLAITHGEDGVGVTLACPQYVATPLIGLGSEDTAQYESLLTADEVAQAILSAVEQGAFLALPHPEVARFAQMRAQDHDGWIKGMRRLRARAISEFGEAGPAALYRLL
jgi:NAD(P)-dependent dehydrogenase (short-subunit alcohol dehydrogenase family)